MLVLVWSLEFHTFFLAKDHLKSYQMQILIRFSIPQQRVHNWPLQTRQRWISQRLIILQSVGYKSTNTRGKWTTLVEEFRSYRLLTSDFMEMDDVDFALLQSRSLMLMNYVCYLLSHVYLYPHPEQVCLPKEHFLYPALSGERDDAV